MLVAEQFLQNLIRKHGKCKERCELQHITNWFNLFVNMHNKEIEKKIVVK